MASEPKASTSTADDAAEYVESIMSAQQIVRVDTPGTSRERNRSAPSPTYSTMMKKARSSQASPSAQLSDDDESPRQASNSRRSLYSDAPTPAPRRKIIRSAHNKKTESDMELAMESLIDRLSVDIGNRFSEIIDRIDRLEQGLEQRIANKVAQVLDKRINSELKRLRKDVDGHIESVTDRLKAEVAADIADINKKLESASPASSPDISCNVVVRNLPENQDENVQEKVTSLIREGCGLHDLSVASAVRKRGHQGKPGVVIAKFKSAADKKSVMMSKRKLKSSRRFQNVYIHHDQSQTDRLIADNFRTMLAAIKSGDNNLSVRGSRVVKGDDRSQNDNRRNVRSNGDTQQAYNRGRQNQAANNSGRNNRYQNRR